MEQTCLKTFLIFLEGEAQPLANETGFILRSSLRLAGASFFEDEACK